MLKWNTNKYVYMLCVVFCIQKQLLSFLCEQMNIIIDIYMYRGQFTAAAEGQQVDSHQNTKTE